MQVNTTLFSETNRQGTFIRAGAFIKINKVSLNKGNKGVATYKRIGMIKLTVILYYISRNV